MKAGGFSAEPRCISEKGLAVDPVPIVAYSAESLSLAAAIGPQQNADRLLGGCRA